MKPPISYDTAVAGLLERFPEFAAAGEKWYPDIPSDAFGTFTLFLSRKIAQGEHDEFIRRSFEYFNDLADTANDDLINLLETSVFEILVDHPRSWHVAERCLRGTALQSWQRARRGGFPDA